MIINGNSLEELKKFPDNYFHSVVTDPPYGLSFMGKKWDYDVPSVELWQEVFRVLKEGGYLLSFAGTRTQHRMAVNIEDAGFEIRDMIAWVYGSGFPKSHNIGKAIDKTNGEVGRNYKFTQWMRTTGITSKQINEVTNTGMGSHYLSSASQPAIPTKELFEKIKTIIEIKIPTFIYELIDRIEAEREVIGINKKAMSGWNMDGTTKFNDRNITLAELPEAKEWEGWGTALKPALEPITMARKPFKGTVANNVLTNGVGGINIDGCRVGRETIKGQKAGQGFNNVKGFGVNTKKGNEKAKEYISEDIKGRFPANFIHDGSDEVKDLFPYNKSGGGIKNPINSYRYRGNSLNKSITKGDGKKTEKSEGSASRFFYCAKASKKDRNQGLEDFEEKIIIGRDEGQDKLTSPRKPRPILRKNFHPTVKPTDLMRYLVRLVTPKNGIVLDCFMGSGSTGKACALEGFEFVGIDLDKDYCEIAKARIDKAIEDKKQDEAQTELF